MDLVRLVGIDVGVRDIMIVPRLVHCTSMTEVGRGPLLLYDPAPLLGTELWAGCYWYFHGFTGADSRSTRESESKSVCT